MTTLLHSWEILEICILKPHVQFYRFFFFFFTVTNCSGPLRFEIKQQCWFYFPGNDTSASTSFDNGSAIICENVSRSIDDFPPDFFTDDQRRHGAVVFHFLVAFYGFVFIAFVCNDYFLPSVFCICLGKSNLLRDLT